MARKIFFGALGIIVILAILDSIKDSKSTTRSNSTDSREQASAEQSEQDAQITRAAMGAASVIAAARNPDSVKFSRVFVTKDGTACYLWRAQNGFGGMNKENAVLLPKAENLSQSVALWNSHCAKKSDSEITDMTALVEQRMTLLRTLAGQ